MSWLTTLIKVARPGFWPTHLWFFLLPFGQREMFGSWTFFAGCFYVTFPLGLLIYGWNDKFDAETDRQNDRKDSWLFGACVDDTGLARLPFWIAASQVPFALLFAWVAGPILLLWFVAMVLVNALYNQPPFGFKNRPILDVLNQLGYLLVFVLASWLCGVAQLNSPAMLFSGLFAMQCHVFGQLMDIEQDTAAGRRTTASLVGVRGGKVLIAAFMFAEAAVAFVWFTHIAVAGFMVAGALFFLGDAALGFKGKPYPTLFSKLFFVGWNVVVIVTAYLVWRTGIFMLVQ